MGDEVTAALIIIGNEVLSGRTQDANLHYIANELVDCGIRLREVRVVADDEAAIIKAVNELRPSHRYVFTTGGIGPTHDDITNQCVAKAFGVQLCRDPRAVALLLRQIKPENLNEARLRMATLPEGCELIDNPISHAPGYVLGNVYVLAGVPRIMRAMFDGLKAGLKGGARLLSLSVTIYGSEGLIAARLAEIQAGHPELEIGSYPFTRDGVYGTVIVIRGTDRAAQDAAGAEVREMARQLGVRTESENGA